MRLDPAPACVPSTSPGATAAHRMLRGTPIYFRESEFMLIQLAEFSEWRRNIHYELCSSRHNALKHLLFHSLAASRLLFRIALQEFETHRQICSGSYYFLLIEIWQLSQRLLSGLGGDGLRVLFQVAPRLQGLGRLFRELRTVHLVEV